MYAEKERHLEQISQNATASAKTKNSSSLLNSGTKEKTRSHEQLAVSAWGSPYAASSVQNNSEVWLDNKSSRTIYYKPESGAENDSAKSLAAGQKLSSPIDGFAAPHLYKEHVCKVVTGSLVTVDDSDYSTSSSSGVNSVKRYWGQVLTGGWKGEDWLDLLTANELIASEHDGYAHTTNRTPVTPDYSWIALFEKSGLANAWSYTSPHSHRI